MGINMKTNTVLFFSVLLLGSLFLIKHEASAKSMELSMKFPKVKFVPVQYIEGSVTEVSDSGRKTYMTKMPSNLAEEICMSIEKAIERYSILIDNNDPDIIVNVEVKKINQITYNKDPIVEEVRAMGYRNEKELFSVSFVQEINYIDFRFWKSAKTPEQIGSILSKKIMKEIKDAIKKDGLVVSKMDIYGYSSRTPVFDGSYDHKWPR